MASDDELRALCRAMRELNRGVIEILPNRGSTSVPNEGGFDLLTMLARESARPVTWLALLDLPGTPPDAHQRTVERLAPLLRSGLRILPQVTPRPIQQYYTMREPFIFAALDSWKGIFNRGAEEQMALAARRISAPRSATKSKAAVAMRFFAAAGIAYTSRAWRTSAIAVFST